MNTEHKTEALQLADRLEREMYVNGSGVRAKTATEAAAELRRLQAENDALRAKVEAMSKPQEPVAYLAEHHAFRVSPHGQDAEGHDWLEMSDANDPKAFPVYTAPAPTRPAVAGKSTNRYFFVAGRLVVDSIHSGFGNDAAAPRAEHVTDGNTCWCNPMVITEENGDVIVHNQTDNWQQYATPGETAQACIERHRSEQDALMTLLKEQRAAPQAEAPTRPARWEWRFFDSHPHTVTSGQWFEWKPLEPRNCLCTIDDALAEMRAYIAQGGRYQLRPLYAGLVEGWIEPQAEAPVNSVSLKELNEIKDLAEAQKGGA